MSRDEKTDRFRPVFEPEDIFDRFVKNANASTETIKPREDEKTGQIPSAKVEREHLAAARRRSQGDDKPTIPVKARGRAESKKALASKPPEEASDEASPSDEYPTGQAPKTEEAKTDSEPARRGGPPSWDHRITVLRNPSTVEAEVGAGKAADSDEAETPPLEGAPEDQEADAPRMPTVAERDRGTVRVRTPYGEDLSKSQELPDVEVDEEEETRIARSPLAKRPMGISQKITAVAPSGLSEALAEQLADGVQRDKEGTRPDAPMPLAMARAFDDEPEPSLDDDGSDDATVPRGSPLLTDSGQRILLLTKRKQPTSTETVQVDTEPESASGEEAAPLDHDILADLSSQSWKSVVAARGQHTQRLEAMKVVPDVEAAQKKKDGTAVVEGGEDGQMPTRQLDQILSDMAVLLRYGHVAQVRERLDGLRRTYPEDLLLLRAIAEFYVENELKAGALDTLFVLAGGLFERRNVEGMRQALEQVLVLDPENERAFRLLGLLEQRLG